MQNTIWTYTTTVATKAQAEKLSYECINKSLAACVQMEGPIVSIFVWKGNQEESEEYRLTFKVSRNSRDPFLSWIRLAHPYETPEILGNEVESLVKEYTDWVNGV